MPGAGGPGGHRSLLVRSQLVTVRLDFSHVAVAGLVTFESLLVNVTFHEKLPVAVARNVVFEVDFVRAASVEAFVSV